MMRVGPMVRGRAAEGHYIVIEGNDGTGKSTQVALLAEWLRSRGREVVVVEEPGSDDLEKSTPVANELRRVIKNGELVRAPEINLALFSAARRELWQQKIRPSLERGAVVLSARNYLSTLVYQGYGEGLDETEIVRMTELFTSERYLKPDVMVILTLSHAKRAERIAMRGKLTHPDTFESRDQTFQDTLNVGYEAVARTYSVPLLSADGDIEAVQTAVREVVTTTLST